MGYREKLWLEAIWWIFTLFVAVLILIPIYGKTRSYPFFTINVIFIVAFITLTRYIFFLRYTFIARQQIIKTILVFLSIPLIFNLINNLNYFVTYLDENSFDPFLGHLPYDGRGSVETYIRTEMLLFGTGSIISAFLFPFRMIHSIWRIRNRGEL